MIFYCLFKNFNIIYSFGIFRIGNERTKKNETTRAAAATHNQNVYVYYKQEKLIIYYSNFSHTNYFDGIEIQTVPL